MNPQLTNPNKILYPEIGITKLDLANYYESVRDWILPYVSKRPLTLVRCPEGYHEGCFYQKKLYEKNEGLYSKNTYIYLTGIEGILSLVQLGVLEIHTWNSQITNLEKPDMMIFDLDPAPDVPWKQVVKAAHYIRAQLEKIELRSFVKTTGGKGLHLVIPIRPYYDWDKIKKFTHHIVKALVAENPNDFIGVMTKSKRTGKIFIDYLRNQKGATSIAPYSTRAHKNAPIATPLSWKELTPKIKPDSFTIKNISRRLSGLRTDPWEDFFTLKQSITYEL